MKERPILFSAPMVRAILEGRKTQTRRVVKPRHDFYMDDSMSWPVFESYVYAEDDIPVPCPYGRKGDSLWVRETFSIDDAAIFYRASDHADCGPWKPSIHMPRRASRIDLLVTGIRVERLQDISEEDAGAEGVSVSSGDDDCSCHLEPLDCECDYRTHKRSFSILWDSINGKPRQNSQDISWAANPYVWVVEFERIAKSARLAA